jgi:hypothetical protein
VFPLLYINIYIRWHSQRANRAYFFVTAFVAATPLKSF